MKTQMTQIGIGIAALSALVVEGKDFNRAELNAMLDRLAASPEPKVRRGPQATCYKMAMPQPERFEYVCKKCGTHTVYPMNTRRMANTLARFRDTVRARVRDWIAMAERGDHRALMIDTAENSYSEAYLQKYRKLYPLLGAVGRPKSYERFLANARAILDFDARGELGKIACPTLILGGEEDRIVGAEASRELHGAIAGSELYIYPGLGHAAYEEAKDFNERIYRFLEG